MGARKRQASTGGAPRRAQPRETKRLRPDRRSLVHEISQYQEQLIAQREALIRAQSELEDTRDRFVELYDFAPVGYVVLNERGIITQCNMTAAALLNRVPQRVEGLPLNGFVAIESRRRFAEFLRRCRLGESDVSMEAVLHNGERRLEVELTGRSRHARNARREFLTSIVHISARKDLERQVTRSATEHAALAGHLLGAIDEERRRIARNLHDDLGQRVTAIRLRMEGIARDQPETLPSAFAAVQRLIEDLDHQLHFVATDLRPPALDLGLVSGVRQHVRRWSTAVHLPTQLRVEEIDDADIAEVTKTHLFRIIQEALNNVAKHAAARRVSVTLKRRDGELVLAVEDDGRGFDPAQQRDDSLLGIVGMRERAILIGGRLHIDSVRGRGTSLFVYAPLSRGA